MKKLSTSDLEDLALGAAVLGSGGGGNPAYELLMAKQQFEDFGATSLVKLSDIEDDAMVATVAFMGAPLVFVEKIPSGNELMALIEMIAQVKGKAVTHLLAGEIGGSNAFTPIIAGSQTGLPVIDADTLGRAFPELQMSSCNLNGISASPALLADSRGNIVITHAKKASDVEKFCRSTTVEMGSSAAIAFYLMTGKECKNSVIEGTFTKAIGIGRTMRLAKEKGEDPIQSLLNYTKGTQIGSGMITDINQVIEEGFLKGTFTISGKSTIKVHYQNEYLMAYEGDQIIGATPDIIIPLEQETGLPITSESLVYGLRVALIVIPGPDIWKTEKGLALVGPQYFGYEKKENQCQQTM